jgi:hypothetical protein
LIERVRVAVKIPVLAAGGIVDQEGVRQALDAGAVAAVMGTRFLLSEESRAHPDYKLRCLQADRTVLTELFGLGWAEAPHRVVPNAATRRWLGDHDSRGPGWIRRINRLASPLVLRVPEGLQDRGLAIQRPSLPFLGPPMALDDGPASLVDSGPLYAGANVTQILEILPAPLDRLRGLCRRPPHRGTNPPESARIRRYLGGPHGWRRLLTASENCPQTATFCYAQPSGSGLAAPPLKIEVSAVQVRLSPLPTARHSRRVSSRCSAPRSRV